MTRLHVSDVSFTAASRADARSGLLGYIALVVNDSLVLDGVTLRKTAAGHYAVSYPQRTDRFGDRHPLVRPRNDAVRRELEAAIFKALSIDTEGTRDVR